MDIALDRASPTPIYRQIERQIRGMILSGALPTGFRLPPERRLAESLQVNRTTVLAAYRELRVDQLVTSRVGSGTVVLGAPGGEPGERATAGPPWRQLFREGVAASSDSLVRDLLQLTERSDVISLAIGLPAADLMPLEELTRLFERLRVEVGGPLLLHCPTEGHSPLRETLAGWLAGRGITAAAAQVLVLSGSQQGLDLAARAFLEPGDLVVLEEPSYFGAMQVFRAAGARLVGVPTDADGMRVDLLESILEHRRPKLIYTLPTFQNPSGAVLSLERRRRLIELAARWQVPVLEDDPYSDLRYDGEPLPSLKALDVTGGVLYLSTFSKVLFPGLRLGFLVAPRAVVRQLALIKQLVDLHASSVAQYLLDAFFTDGLYAAHLARVRAVYRERRDAMAAALERHAPPGVTWNCPQGGFYFWLRLPAHVDRARLVARAAEAGVAFLPGWSCYRDAPEETTIRLNFSYLPPDRLAVGVERLFQAVAAASLPGHRDETPEVSTQPIV
jgi:DNA-binding transcriptional MocR family regulator